VAYIVWGYLPKGKGYYVDLWATEDSSSAFKFHQVKTEEEREKLIQTLRDQGHKLIEDAVGD